MSKLTISIIGLIIIVIAIILNGQERLETSDTVKLPVASQSQIKEFWFSGAEINRYELDQSRYGEQHQGNAVLVFVTEPFLTDKHVKHESGVGQSVNVLN